MGSVAIFCAYITFYKKREEKSKIHTFDDCYWNWRKIQDVLVAENTTSKYNTDYKRYFENTDFVKINIAELTADDIKVFLVTKVKELHLCNKAYKTLFGYTHNTILRAKTLKLIPVDIMEDLKSKDFYKYCTQKKKPLEKHCRYYGRPKVKRLLQILHTEEKAFGKTNHSRKRFPFVIKEI